MRRRGRTIIAAAILIAAAAFVAGAPRAEEAKGPGTTVTFYYIPG